MPDTRHILDPHDLFGALTDLELYPIVAVSTDVDPLDLTTDDGGWLTTARREEIARWRSAQRRRHFRAGRVAAHDAAACALGGDSRDFEVVIGARGAPRVRRAERPERSWQVAITHSGGWALATIAPDGWLLGLDYEVGAIDRPHLQRRVCSPLERARFDLEAGEGAGPRFEPIWVLKEALLKAYTVGLIERLDSISVTALGEDGAASLEVHRATHPDLPCPLPDTLRAAVASLFDDRPLAVVLVPTPRK